MKRSVTAISQVLTQMRTMHDQGVSWEDAAGAVKRLDPTLFSDALEDVGCYPASDADVRAVQKVGGIL